MWTADDMVDSVFLIYLKNIDNRGFCVRFRSLSTLSKQWGVNTAGYVSFPISFVFRSIVLTTHQGTGYLQSWPVEYSPKAGFTLRVDQNSDSQWISIGY